MALTPAEIIVLFLTYLVLILTITGVYYKYYFACKAAKSTKDELSRFTQIADEQTSKRKLAEKQLEEQITLNDIQKKQLDESIKANKFREMALEQSKRESPPSPPSPPPSEIKGTVYTDVEKGYGIVSLGPIKKGEIVSGIIRNESKRNFYYYIIDENNYISFHKNTGMTSQYFGQNEFIYQVKHTMLSSQNYYLKIDATQRNRIEDIIYVLSVASPIN